MSEVVFFIELKFNLLYFSQTPAFQNIFDSIYIRLRLVSHISCINGEMNHISLFLAWYSVIFFTNFIYNLPCLAVKT